MSEPTLGDVLRIREFRALWAAMTLSVLGDQLSRVALSVLVFTRTGSATLSATTYALTFLPSLLGGVLLGWVADRLPRRAVMVGADTARALLTASMAIPGLPLPVLAAILVVTVLLGAPHTAASGALIPEITGERHYEAALGLRQMTNQTAQVVGFAAGGVVVAAVGPELGLLLDAATFAASALVVRVGLEKRPRPVEEHEGGGVRDVLAGFAAIATDPGRRALVLLAWMVGLYVVPEALAVPYVAAASGGAGEAGLLMAADPLGSVVGAWVYVRFVSPERREQLVGVVAAAAGLPLVAMLVDPPLPVVAVLFALTGAFATAYLLQTQASFVRRTPDRVRGQAIGVAASGVVASQGLAVLLAGFVADAWDATVGIAVSGAVGVLVTGLLAVAWARARGAAVETPAQADPKARNAA